MQLSPHFSLAELSITQVRGVDNTPPPAAVVNLRRLAQTLEQVRIVLGSKIIIVNSGFRSPEVNARVGGVKTSAHVQGYAADFICPSFGTPLEVCRAIQRNTGIRFDQLINEGAHGKSLGWVHISVATPRRRQVLTATFSEDGQATYGKGLG